MAVRKRGNAFQIDYFDPGGKRIRKNFDKKKDAEAEYAKRISLIAEGRYLDIKPEFLTSMGCVLDKYKENHKHQTSYKRYKKSCLNNFKEYFGEDRQISSVRYVDIETYRNHLRQKPTPGGALRKDASVNREMSCLHHVFDKAKDWEMIETSPFDRGKSLILKENNQRLRFLTEEEIHRLLVACSVHLRPIVICALNTGMRRAEILSLKWDQIRNGFIYLTKTKTNEARQIPVNDTLELLFRQIRQKHQLRSDHVFLYWKERIKTGKDWIGPPLNEVKRSFHAALKRAQIEDFHFHDLRHTFASQIIMNGGGIKDVQEILGHKTMTMTLRYAHLSQEHKKQTVNLLNRLTNISDQNFQDCHKSVTNGTSKISLVS
jgi:integrase